MATLVRTDPQDQSRSVISRRTCKPAACSSEPRLLISVQLGEDMVDQLAELRPFAMDLDIPLTRAFGACLLLRT